MSTIAIIGGGAAGYFAAINLKEKNPNCSVTIFESAPHSLAKVAVSGGGRCNLTNTFAQIKDLKKAYPRGSKLIKRAFKLFDYRDTVEWFERHGIRLTTQDDECLFPQSQSSYEIIDTFIRLTEELDITVKHSRRIDRVLPNGDGYTLHFVDPKLKAREFDVVVVAVGGSPKMDGFEMFRELSLSIEKPVPSLFSFNIPNDPITSLMGCVVERAEVSLVGSKLAADGALLITHWGFSGPAVLRLSSYGARVLNEANYEARISVNWIAERRTEHIAELLRNHIAQHSAKLVTSRNPFELPSRLWTALLLKSGIACERRFAEIGSKGLNRLINTLTNDEYQISGQSRFRDEFVTAGGVALTNLDMQSCEVKSHPNLYFAGEITDVDAITGGFNLQAAWSMGYCVAHSIDERLKARS